MKNGAAHHLLRMSILVLLTFAIAGGHSFHHRLIAEDHPLYGRKLATAEKPKTLKMLASKMRANYALMKTWRGTYAITDLLRSTGTNQSLPENRLPGAEWTTAELSADVLARIPAEKRTEGVFWTITTGLGKFSIDNTKGMFSGLFDASQPIIYFDLASGLKARWARSTGPIRYSIFSNNDAIQFDPGRNETEIPGLPVIESMPRGRVVHRVSPKNASRSNMFFDPRDYLVRSTFRAEDNRQHWNHCELLARMLQTEREFQEKRDKATSLYVNPDLPPIYTLVFNGGKGFEELYRFDGKAAFNVVLHYQKINGELFNQTVTTYRNESGIYVPETFERTSNVELPDGGFKPHYVRSTALVKSEMNVELADSEFSVNQFPLKYGDRFADEIEKRLLVHDGVTGFVPAEGFVFDPSRVKK